MFHQLAVLKKNGAFKNLALIAGLSFVVLGLSACQSSQSGPLAVAVPDLSFDGETAVSVQAMNVVFVEDYLPPLKAPNIEHEFKVLPAQVVRNWTADRLRAVGTDGLLTVTVKQASVVEERLVVVPGFQGRFRNEEDRKLSAHLIVGVTYQGPLGNKSAEFEVKAMKTLLENASLHDRERAYFWLIERLKAQTSDVMQERITTTFADVIHR